MFSLEKKRVLVFLCLILFFKLSFIMNVLPQEYLNKVIERLNSVENELKNIKDSDFKDINTESNFNNSIATHEQRIVEIEEEIRNLNGYLDEINFKLDNLVNSINDISNGLSKNITSSTSDDIDIQKKRLFSEQNENIYDPSLEEKKTIISEDPNKKNNPEMKVLGTIKKETMNQNIDIENFEKKQVTLSTSEDLKKLAQNPSDIYKYAYDMLIRENYDEAEKSFKTFIGEHPKDSLASNAYYWLGETYYVQKKFQLAAISFARGYKNFPKGNKALDQLFKLALTFMNLGKNEDACASFSKLELEFPTAPKRISSRAKEYKQRAKCRV